VLQESGLAAQEETGMWKDNSSTVQETWEHVIGLDVSDETSTYVVIQSRTGEMVAEGTVATTRAGMKRAFGVRPASLLAIEAGTHSPWLSRFLADLGHEVIVANPRQVALIARSKRKNDRLDALALARLGRFDPALLHPIKHRGKEAQLDLVMLRIRDSLVTNRTRLINQVRSIAKSFGEPLPKCSAEAFPAKATASLSVELLELVQPLLANIATFTDQERAMAKKAERLAEHKYGDAALPRQVNGVGLITSLAYVLTLEEPNRFASSRDVPAYLGITPGQRQSGKSDPQLHITKAGDAFLRKLLIQCAHYILGPFGADCDLRTWGLKLAGASAPGKRGSDRAKKRAVTAVARKLAVLLHHLWRTGATYEPHRQRKDVIAAA
jgi:transposase